MESPQIDNYFGKGLRLENEHPRYDPFNHLQQHPSENTQPDNIMALLVVRVRLESFGALNHYVDDGADSQSDGRRHQQRMYKQSSWVPVGKFKENCDVCYYAPGDR